MLKSQARNSCINFVRKPRLGVIHTWIHVAGYRLVKREPASGVVVVVADGGTADGPLTRVSNQVIGSTIIM